MVWYGMVWYGMVWFGMVWYGMVWYGMVWYGMVWYGILCITLLYRIILAVYDVMYRVLHHDIQYSYSKYGTALYSAVQYSLWRIMQNV